MEKSEGQSRPEVLCRVCGDKASGKHYGVASCDGCRGFFKRSIRRNLDYVCKESNSCIVDVTRRNQCQACRFRKCLQVNMKRDAVQHERAPRSTSNTMKPKYLSCYPYYFPFKSTFYGPPFFGSMSSSPISAAPAASNKFPFEISKFDLLPTPPPTVPSGLDIIPTRRTTLPGAVSTPEDSLSIMISNPMLHSSSNTISSSANCSRSSNVSVRPTTTPAEVPSPSTDSAAGVKEDEVSSSGVDLHTQGFKIDLSLLTLNNESVYESAAKLLFLSIKWARSVPSFLHLPFADQTLLLEEAWPELFILSASQWSLPMDDSLLCSVISSPWRETVVSELRHLRDALARVAAVRPDHTELACLKALVLFKPETTSLQESLQVEILQDQTHLMLQEYCTTKQPPNKIRFGKLLLLLASIRRVSGTTLKELFFKQTVGDVPIERLISDMFKAN